LARAVFHAAQRIAKGRDAALSRRVLFGDKVPQAYPLREWGWGLAEVKDYLHRRSVTVPKRTDCAWCYDQSLPDEDGVIVHDNVPHPEMTFDEEERPQ